MSETKKAEIREKKIRVRQELMSVLQGLSEAEWEMAIYTGGGHWTISDLLRHLVNADRGMTTLINQFRQGQDPVPADFDRERYNNRIVEKAKQKSPTELMAELVENEALFLETLAALTESDWQKKGRHASLHVLTIEEICHLIPDHEQAHLLDIQKALNAFARQ
jgi:uncharacterized damage-inducible protein DinB